MAEKKRKMYQPDSPSPSLSISLPPSPSEPSSSTLQLQFHPNTPKISNYTPKILRRMETDTCFRCNQQGHWSLFCPLNSSTSNHDSNYPNIWCRCGHGFCEVKTVSNNKKNRGKKYYACPIKRGKKCGDFVKWCDGDNLDESDLRPPLYKYPECECGAGVCRKEKGTEGPYGGGYYFTCPVRENHGSCGYRVWEDELLDNNKGTVPIHQSSQRIHVFLEVHKNKETDYDLGNGEDLLLGHSKRMRVIDNSGNPSTVVASEFSKREDASLKEASSKFVGFSDLEVADYLQDLEFANSVSWETINEKPFLLSRPSTPSRICGQQSLFQGNIFADASFGPCPMGWLGRLIFFYPTQSLTFPSSEPFSCCVFPSFNPIDVPKQVSIGDGPCESSQLAYNSLSLLTQISTGCDTEVSGDAVTPSKSPASERKPMSKAERQRQVVLFAQQQLLVDLETSDLNEHESMREAAEATFDMLDNLGVNYKQFSEHVRDYIDLASSMAEMDNSMESSLTFDEYNKRLEEEKVRFARVQDDCFNTETSLQASNQRRQTLIEEISHLEAMLYEKQTQLKSCELKNLHIETHLGDFRRSLVEADATLKVTAEEAKVASQLNEERQAKQIAAKTALDMAKLELVNV